MYPTIPSSVVRNGLISGYRCPVTLREFVGFEASKSRLAGLYAEQQAYTRQVMSDLDDGSPDLGRDPATYRTQYAAIQSSHPERFRADGSFKTPKELQGNQ